MDRDPDDHLIAPWSRSSRASARAIAAPIRSFMAWEAAGGVALLAATVVALLWANIATSSYESFWTTSFTLGVGDHLLTTNLSSVVTDGLMTLFFLLIGLEVKREMAVGELSDRRAAALPIAAALGGMLIPAALYLAIAWGGPAQSGWGIPMATDVAFALALLSTLRSRVPRSLWAFLLGVAVIDDIGAIVVIAAAYSDGIVWAWLAGAVICLLAMHVLARMHVRAQIPYIALGILTWALTATSGVHATIAGVAIGLLTPVHPLQRPAAVSREARRVADLTADDPSHPDADAEAWLALASISREAVSPLTRTVNAVHPWSSFAVLPLFALANAGIVVNGDTFAAAGATTAAMAVAIGLVVGKAIGLPLGAFAAVRSGVGRMPDGARPAQIVGIGLVAGIGFTVSLFITDLAFDNPGVSGAAKVGVLAASIVAALAGALMLLASGRRSADPE